MISYIMIVDGRGCLGPKGREIATGTRALILFLDIFHDQPFTA